MLLGFLYQVKGREELKKDECFKYQPPHKLKNLGLSDNYFIIYY